MDKLDLTQNALQTPSGAPSAETTQLRTQLTSELTNILKDVGGADGRVASNDAGASPEDTFRDLQAYRNLLRAYEASNALDDTHDLGGNTFYRVQFRATVNPESIRDRFGVIEVVATKPTMTDEAIVQLYWTWLNYVTRQLNQSRAMDLTTFTLLPESEKLFGIVNTGLRSDGRSVRLAVPPALQNVFEKAVSDPNIARKAQEKARQLKEGVRHLRGRTDFVGTTDECPVPIGSGLDPRNAKRLFPL